MNKSPRAAACRMHRTELSQTGHHKYVKCAERFVVRAFCWIRFVLKRNRYEDSGRTAAIRSLSFISAVTLMLGARTEISEMLFPCVVCGRSDTVFCLLKRGKGRRGRWWRRGKRGKKRKTTKTRWQWQRLCFNRNGFISRHIDKNPYHTIYLLCFDFGFGHEFLFGSIGMVWPFHSTKKVWLLDLENLKRERFPFGEWGLCEFIQSFDRMILEKWRRVANFSIRFVPHVAFGRLIVASVGEEKLFHTSRPLTSSNMRSHSSSNTRTITQSRLSTSRLSEKWQNHVQHLHVHHTHRGQERWK